MSQYDCGQQQVSLDRAPNQSDEIRNMHDIFLDPYRCAVLHYLQRTETSVTLHELAITVDEWSPDGDAAAEEYGDHPRAWLRDNHVLPMDAFGVVEYDHDADIVHLPEDVVVSVSTPWDLE